MQSQNRMQHLVKYRVVLIFLLGVLAAVAVRAADAAWRHENALCRLRVSVSSRRGRQLRVDIPVALRARTRGVAAYTDDGKALAASLLTVGGQPRAVWFAVGRLGKEETTPSGKAIPLPVEIYLLPEETSPVPLRDDQRRPVRFMRTTQSLLTRPFTDREAVLLLNDTFGADGKVYAFDIHDLGVSLDRDNWQQPPERRSAVMLWQAGFFLEKEETVRFGSDQQHVAWFAFVDDQPVGSWRRAQEDDTAVWGDPVTLAPGPHEITFLAVQSHGEAIPACLWRRKGEEKGGPVTGTFPSSHPDAVDMQLRPDDPARGLACTEMRRYLFDDTGTDLLALQMTATDGKALPERILESLDGAQVLAVSKSGDVVVPNRRIPAVNLNPGADESADLRLPPRRAWVPAQRLLADLRLGAMPVVARPSAAVDLELFVSFSEPVGARLRRHLVVRAIQFDRHGKQIDAREVISGSTGRQALSLRLKSDTVRVVFQTCVGAAPIAADRVLRVLHPNTLTSNLIAHDGALFMEGQRVLLLSDPMTLPGAVTPRPSAANTQRIALLDDFLAGEDAPGASHLPESRIGVNWDRPPAVFRESVGPHSGAGVLPSIAKFTALGRLLEMRPDVVILAVGASDLRRGVRAETVCEHLLFLAQAARSAGARPVLVALPGLPDVPDASMRRAALLCKELAWRLGASVIDAHSQNMLSSFGGPSFADLFSIADGTLAMNVPNDYGRDWFCSLVERALVSETGEQNP